MILRADAIRARLLRLEEVLSRLEKLADSPQGTDFRESWAVERGLQLAAEILFDIGNHILSSHFGVSASDYEDVLLRLQRQGVIEESLLERLRGLGGFRNILVHDYLRLDPARVATYLEKGPTDFNDFALAISAWLDEVEPSA